VSLTAASTEFSSALEYCPSNRSQHTQRPCTPSHLRLEDVLQVPGLEPATTDSAGGLHSLGWAVGRGGRCPIGDRMWCGRLTGAVQFRHAINYQAPLLNGARTRRGIGKLIGLVRINILFQGHFVNQQDTSNLITFSLWQDLARKHGAMRRSPAVSVSQTIFFLMCCHSLLFRFEAVNDVTEDAHDSTRPCPCKVSPVKESASFFQKSNSR
jgi:hypothetical protein